MPKNECPCGTGNTYSLCCGQFISGKINPETPEQLMRSRYSAYHQQQFSYIRSTMLPPALNHFDIEDLRQSAQSLKWTKLEVIQAHDNIVEFKAHYRIGQAQHVIHEVSEFKRVDGKWYYVDGSFKE